MLVDIHTHIHEFPSEEIDGVLERANAASVGAIFIAGTSIASSAKCITLSNTHECLFAGVGIHPMDVEAFLDEKTLQSMKEMVEANPKVVAISEIGLDFSQNAPPLPIQYQTFRETIRLAREVKLPIIFHSRELAGYPETHNEVLKILNQERGWEVGGAMHYFQGDETTAKKCLDSGFLISLGKPLLRQPRLQELVKTLPQEGIVLETDSYPQPFKQNRENWTEPGHLNQIAEKLSELTQTEIGAIHARTSDNILNVYRRLGKPKITEYLNRRLTTRYPSISDLNG